MNNTRMTVNSFLKLQLGISLPGVLFITGDEDRPKIVPPCISIKWLDGDKPGITPECRLRSFQVEVWASDQDSELAERFCKAVNEALRINQGSDPMAVIPKLNYTNPPNEDGLPTPYQLTFRRNRYQSGWVTLEPPQQQARMRVASFDVNYFPD